MRLRVTRISEGPGPGEIIIEIITASGETEEVVIHSRAIDEGDTIDVGNPIADTDGRSLVELPRESVSGSWRVWVPQANFA